MLDSALQMFGSYQSYKEDGSIADIMAPAEMLMEPVDTIIRKLPKAFRKWVLSRSGSEGYTQLQRSCYAGRI